MMDMEYQKFKHEQDRKMSREFEQHIIKANQAHNEGLWNAVKWRNPLAYFVLRKTPCH